jgi:lysophospholipase L1-like esterase
VAAEGERIGWARRLAGLLRARTGVWCTLTNLAADGANVTTVLERQLPAVAALRPDLVSVTVGMNDIRVPEFSEASFASGLGRLFDELAETGATLLTCTLPDIATSMPLTSAVMGLARERMRAASEIIREQADKRGARCLDLWSMPEVADPQIYGPDRIHPNARGHRMLATACADLLLSG